MTQGKITHLTNDELTQQLSLRDDLTELEYELLDRLIRAQDELHRADVKVTAVPAGASVI